MWGYGSRHDKLSEGTLEPLTATALVLNAGGQKLALAALDLGRSPSEASLERIAARLRAEAGIEHAFIAGSHTHHAPVLELSDEEGKGKGKFDAALRYYPEMESAIVAAVLEANKRLAPATLATGSAILAGFNTNRHTKFTPKPVDPELAILRVDTAAGQPLAVMANFAAHPTMLPDREMRFSPDFPGALRTVLEKETGATALFLQGAAGDLSADRSKGGYLQFGAALGREALTLYRTLTPAAPATPALAVRGERFRFDSRIDLSDPFTMMAYSQAFFPELVRNFRDEYTQGVRPRATVALLNGDTVFLAASGEFFANHAVRLKQRARVKQVFFLGYANGYHQYFPTIEAVAEGGYGADQAVAPAAVGAGEQIMNRALIWIYQLLGRIKG
jgi:hypothetical protein